MSSAPSAPPAGRPGLMIAVAAAVAFLATFNETFLNVALAPIMADFGIGVPTAQWLATGHMLTAAVFVPVSAHLHHRFPTRALFCTVIGIMMVGSVIGALAPSFPVLLAGRLLQAIGTGLLIPIGMNVTVAASPRERLGLYMGIMGAMTTLGPSVSILVSGAMLEITTWRALMWLFTALSLLVLIAGAVALRTLIPLGRPRLDAVSVVLIAVGLVGLLYGISTAFSGALVGAFALLVGWAGGGSSLLLIAALYVPMIAGTALVVGPAQTFALSQLSREQSPHGVTMFGTGFQVAGCVGTATATGVYGAVFALRIAGGAEAVDAAVTGFRAVGVLVALLAALGVVMALAAARSARVAAVEGDGGKVLDGPVDSPFGRVTTIADPVGATLQLVEPPADQVEDASDRAS